MECFSENIVKALRDIADRKLISLETLQNRITKCLIDLSVNESLHILESFLSADLTNVENKEQFLYEMFLDHLNTIKKTSGKVVYLDGTINDISDKNKINQLLTRTGYDLTISTGQRRYGGPPPNWTGDPPDCSNPSTCSQVHIGKLAQTVFEDILVPLLETCGKIYQLRIMTDPATGNNKGYGFVDFFAHAEALKCVETLNNKNLLGSHIQVKITVPNCRLWVSGFSKKRNLDNINYEFKRHFPNLVDIKCFESKTPPQKNKGFCFLIFKNHNEANEARKKLLQNKILIFNNPIRECEWADPIESEEKSDLLPKKLHIKFLSGKVDREYINSTFAQFGEIKSLDLFEQYAFVEFNSENSVNNALAQNITEINKQNVSVSAAKTSKLTKEQINRRKRHFRDRQRMRPEFMFQRLPSYNNRDQRISAYPNPRNMSRQPEYYDYPPEMPYREMPRDYPPRDYPQDYRGNDYPSYTEYPPRQFSPEAKPFPRQGVVRAGPIRDDSIRGPQRDYQSEYPPDLADREPSRGLSVKGSYHNYPEPYSNAYPLPNRFPPDTSVPVRDFDRIPPPRRDSKIVNDFARKESNFSDIPPIKNYDSAPTRFPAPPGQIGILPIDGGSNAFASYRTVDPARPMPPPRLETPIVRPSGPTNYQAPPPYQMPHARQW